MSARWWGDKREWGLVCGTGEAKITSVKILDGFGKESNKFNVNDKIIVKAEFEVCDEVRDPHFGVAIFRDDNIYCYGPNTQFDGHKIENLAKGKGWFSIDYERMPLMPGKYLLSVGIWDKKELLPYSFHITRYDFIIKGVNKDRQLLFLPYRWNNSELIDLFIPKEITPVDLNFLKKKRQGENTFKNSDKFDITSIQLMNSEENVKDSFNTGELMKIAVKITGEIQQYHFLWIGMYRADDIYCHGATKKLSRGEKTPSLVYPQLPLLPGKYYLSVGVWKNHQNKLLLFKHKAAVFKVTFTSQDHGTVYLEHSWKWELP